MKVKIFSYQDLILALNGNPAVLIINSSILCPDSIILPPGFSLIGYDNESSILSFSNGDGIGLTADNEVSNLIIQTNPNNRAIFTLSNMPDLGNLTLNNLVITGQVQIITRSGTDKARFIARNVDILACDSRRYSERPQKMDDTVYQGAFTVYNYNSNPESTINISLFNISMGRKGAPVIGSGLFICGYSEHGGWVKADHISTGDIYSNGMLPYGQANIITGAVFILYGAKVKNLINMGSVTTYGINDMVLDTWGEVDEWIAESPVTSYGASGVGFVNFGIVHQFEAKAKIETFGTGARGFNQYEGTTFKASFHSIITHGDGAVGMQFSKNVGDIEVKHGITTYGSTGQTLVKGVIMTLPADGVSIKTGGEIQQLRIEGGITTYGTHVTSYSVDGGTVKDLEISGDIIAHGALSNAVMVVNNGQTPLTGFSAISNLGIAVLTDTTIKFSHETVKAKGTKGDFAELPLLNKD
ncbi:hypothetical protein [Chryseobacterium sp. SIMBA_028]|uniref:hypothetical protein n=1 Tax=Chryseobacterium sp. SIMBA_028 TaxID=3085771 RepID=UPI00397CFCEA